jgi:hypothetical protein
MSRTILVCQHESCPRQGAAAVDQAFREKHLGVLPCFDPKCFSCSFLTPVFEYKSLFSVCQGDSLIRDCLANISANRQEYLSNLYINIKIFNKS